MSRTRRALGAAGRAIAWPFRKAGRVAAELVDIALDLIDGLRR